MGYRSGNTQENAPNFVSKVLEVLWGYLRRVLWEDWRAKLFALLFALSLWFFLLSERIL